MSETDVRFLIIITVLFFGLMRWAHRSWEKAALSTLFAPLVAAPLAGASYLGVGMLFKLGYGLLSAFDVEIPVSTIEIFALATTTVIILWLTILYCRDQRHLSLSTTGPALGVVPRDYNPGLNAKGSLK